MMMFSGKNTPKLTPKKASFFVIIYHLTNPFEIPNDLQV